MSEEKEKDYTLDEDASTPDVADDVADDAADDAPDVVDQILHTVR